MQYRFPDSAIGPARHAFAITPHDTNAVPQETKAIYVGTGGDITLRCRDSQTDVVFKAVPAGMTLDLCVQFIRAAGTTAADIVGIA